MNWIRIAVTMKSDPRIGALAHSLRIRTAEAVGLVVSVLSELPTHAKDGDLSTVPDAALELWATWHGKRGEFAQHFRLQMCDAAGVIRAWEKHNGAAIRASDADRERLKAWRDKKKEARDETRFSTRSETGSETGTVPVVKRVPSPVTGRDGTGRDELPQQQQFATAAKKPRRGRDEPSGLAEGWSSDWVGPLADFVRDQGRLLIEPGRLGKAFKTAVRHYPRPNVEQAILDSIAHAKIRGVEWAPESVATDMPRLVKLVTLSVVDDFGGDTDRGRYIAGKSVA